MDWTVMMTRMSEYTLVWVGLIGRDGVKLAG